IMSREYKLSTTGVYLRVVEHLHELAHKQGVKAAVQFVHTYYTPIPENLEQRSGKRKEALRPFGFIWELENGCSARCFMPEERDLHLLWLVHSLHLAGRKIHLEGLSLRSTGV